MLATEDDSRTIEATIRRYELLWRMYINRISSRKDKSRLNIPFVREAVAATIGPFPHLASDFSSLG